MSIDKHSKNSLQHFQKFQADQTKQKIDSNGTRSISKKAKKITVYATIMANGFKIIQVAPMWN